MLESGHVCHLRYLVFQGDLLAPFRASCRAAIFETTQSGPQQKKEYAEGRFLSLKKLGVTENSRVPSHYQNYLQHCLGQCGRHLQTGRLSVPFPVGTHAWIAGSVPGQGAYRRQLLHVSLSHRCFSTSLSSSLPLSLTSK